MNPLLLGAQQKLSASAAARSKRQTCITAYTNSHMCSICGAESNAHVCMPCIAADPSHALHVVSQECNSLSRNERDMQRMCSTCCGFAQPAVTGPLSYGMMIGTDTCASLDCPIFFERCRLILRIEDAQAAEAEVMRAINDLIAHDQSSSSCDW